MNEENMKQFAVVPLYGFEREPGFLTEIELMPNTYLMRNTKMWASLTDDGFKEAIGTLEYEGIRNSEAAVWFAIPDDEVLTNSRHYLFQALSLVKLFLNMLWAMKDCSVNCKMGFLRWQNMNETGYESNSLGRLYFRASGDTVATLFSESEIRRARAFMLIFSAGISNSYKREQATAIVKGNSRLALFLHHIEAARAAQDLALRVMHGCSALESLLTTTTSELCHQLSERTALFTASDPARQKEVFLHMKTVYDIRSKVAHGSTLKSKCLSDLPNISEKLDSLLRSIFTIVLECDGMYRLFYKGSEDDINNHFVSLLFRAK